MTPAELAIMEQAEAEYDEMFVDFLLFGEKTCTICGAKLPASKEHFGVWRKNADGLTAACRTCKNAASAAWHARKRAES